MGNWVLSGYGVAAYVSVRSCFQLPHISSAAQRSASFRNAQDPLLGPDSSPLSGQGFLHLRQRPGTELPSLTWAVFDDQI
jgi:hypothetical protein